MRAGSVPVCTTGKGPPPGQRGERNRLPWTSRLCSLEPGMQERSSNLPEVTQRRSRGLGCKVHSVRHRPTMNRPLKGLQEAALESRVMLVSSVTQLCPILCDPIDCSTPGFPVHHQLPELAQTHVHQVSDAIPPSHRLSSLSSALNLSQHEGLFK